jgi:hypothetical protein
MSLSTPAPYTHANLVFDSSVDTIFSQESFVFLGRKVLRMYWQLGDFIRLELFHERKFEKLRLVFDCTLILKIMILYTLFK